MTVPAKVADRLSSGLKRFNPIITAAKSRDVNESDTSMIVTDMLGDLRVRQVLRGDAGTRYPRYVLRSRHSYRR
jgi:hypothetical protein